MSRLDEVAKTHQEKAAKYAAIVDVKNAVIKALALGAEVSHIHQALNEALQDDEF